MAKGKFAPSCRHGTEGYDLLCTYSVGREEVGYIALDERAGHGCSVANVEVEPEFRGKRIATRLYEAAAQHCWDEHRLPLRSGYIVSSAALAFWEKQVKKGRAARRLTPPDEKDPDIDDFYNEWRYVLKTPPSRSLGLHRRRR